MNDFISRQAAIDALREYIVDNDMYDMDENVQGFNEGIDLAISELSVIPSAQPEQRWVPCSEQEYPSDNREVEVTCEFTRYDGKKFKYTCHAAYIHRYSVESAGGWEYCDEYNEEEDMYYALPGWYERVHDWDDYAFCAIEDRVVAWRELQDPWRGEET